MALERTFSIIKPDATRRNLTGQINARLEAAGLRIVAQKRKQLTQGEAEAFYAVHAERPFYNDLVAFMTSGPVVVQVLEGENAVLANREVMGATNPADAVDGTIRKDFAESIEANSVHGSDSLENAAIEIAYFFAGCEITSQTFIDDHKKVGFYPAFLLTWIDANRANSKLDQRCSHNHQRCDNRNDADFRSKHEILIDLQMRLALLAE